MNSTVSKLVSAALFALASICHAAGDADDFYEMAAGGDRVVSILQSLPFASEGSGPVIFTFQYAECPYSQGMYRDYKVPDSAVEFRRIFVPVSERSAREAAALGLSRNPRDYHAFMTGTQQAPALQAGSDGARVYNQILTAVDELEAILQQNGWPLKGFRYPQFYWLENGRVFTSAGYERTDFGKAVARARTGGGSADVWAASAGGAAAPTAQSAPAPVPPQQRQSSGADIVGIELGMTQEEAIAAIRAHDTKLNISEVVTDITIQDSYNQPLKVGSYVAEVQAFWDQRDKGYQQSDPREFISLVFAGPPGEHRVQSIEREIRYVTPDSYPDYAGLVQALTRKYGAPDAEQGTIRLWQLDGKPLPTRHIGALSRSANIMQRNPYAYRYHLFPVIDESLPSNVLRISDDGKLIHFGNQTYVDAGRFLAFHITQQGPGVHFMRSVLQESLMTIGRSRKATSDIANAALAEHERGLSEAAARRPGPRL